VRGASAIALLLLGIASSACSTSLDLERAERLLRGSEEPGAPVLVESPAADLPAPEGLRAQAGELREVPLAWDPILAGDVGGYVVERALDPGGPFQRVGMVLDRFETSYLDQGFDLARKAQTVAGGEPGLGDGATYHYRVRAFSTRGHLSKAASSLASATTAPVPATPEGFHAYSHLARKVALTWRPVPDPTVAGYVLYRSPSATGPFIRLAEVSGRHRSTYIDRSLGDLRLFYYRVSARNRAGGEGAATEPVRAVTKPDPLPPVGLRIAEQGLGRNVLAWESNVERDLAGYRVLRWRGSASEPETVGMLAAHATRVEDDAVGAGEKVAYSIVAFDHDGLESEPAEALPVKSVGYELRAEPHDGAVELQWNPRSTEGFTEARVMRLGRLRDKEIARVSAGRHRDADVRSGRVYRYQVVLRHAGGTEAPPSAPVEVRVP
jgi:fibronectin type 3 domain-containing protein